MNNIALFIKKIDDITWNFVPTSLKDIIERRSWLLLLSVYSTLLLLLTYRFAIAKNPIFFHGSTSLSKRIPNIDSSDQIKELLIHLAFFMIPVVLSLTFNRDTSRRQMQLFGVFRLYSTHALTENQTLSIKLEENEIPHDSKPGQFGLKCGTALFQVCEWDIQQVSDCISHQP